MPDRPVGTIVFFDVDHTLIPRTSTEAILIRWLLAHRKTPFGNLLRTAMRVLHDCGARDRGAAFRRNKQYLAGMTARTLEELVYAIGPRAIDSRISAKGRTAIRRLQDTDAEVVLLSAAPTVLVEYVRTAVGADAAIGAPLEERGGILTGDIAGLQPYGVGKVTAALRYAQARGVALTTCTAYANAWSDLPLLRMVGRPVAVNPDRRLRRYAERAHWPIEAFDNVHSHGT